MAGDPAVISAPGAGLGHLVRALAVSLEMEKRGAACRVVTNSPYAEGMARMTGARISSIPDAGWKTKVRDFVRETRPRLLVTDSFPWGLRGEWLGPPEPGLRVVHLARILKIADYMEAMKVNVDSAPPFHASIIAERIPPEQEKALALGRFPSVRLEGRIRLEGLPAPPLPEELCEPLDAGKLVLAVHSGPEREIKTLMDRANREAGKTADAAVTLISPREPAGFAAPWLEYFPASALYGRAAMVVTAAGYNSMAEMSPYREKHVAIAFDRTYDDQALRVKDYMSDVNGAAQAADFLIRCM